MKTEFFLIVNRKGSTRTCKSKPDLRMDEVSVKLSLTLPDALFIKPQIQATITIPDKAANPTEISAETLNNVKDAIETASGMNVSLTLVSNEVK